MVRLDRVNLARVANGVQRSVGLEGWRRNVSGSAGVFRVGGRVDSPGEPVVLREFQSFVLRGDAVRGFLGLAVLFDREVFDLVEGLVGRDEWRAWVAEVEGFRFNRRTLWVFNDFEGSVVLGVRRNRVAAEVGLRVAEVMVERNCVVVV